MLVRRLFDDPGTSQLPTSIDQSKPRSCAPGVNRFGRTLISHWAGAFQWSVGSVVLPVCDDDYAGVPHWHAAGRAIPDVHCSGVVRSNWIFVLVRRRS
jgi:hypothetical protein